VKSGKSDTMKFPTKYKYTTIKYNRLGFSDSSLIIILNNRLGFSDSLLIIILNNRLGFSDSSLIIILNNSLGKEK
jgi:hypothetical protein